MPAVTVDAAEKHAVSGPVRQPVWRYNGEQFAPGGDTVLNMPQQALISRCRRSRLSAVFQNASNPDR